MAVPRWHDPNLKGRELIYEYNVGKWTVCRINWPGSSEHNQLILVDPELFGEFYV